MAGLINQISDSSFESEVLKSNTPVLVDFWAEWCGPCRALAPKLEEISQELNGKLKIVKVNVDDNKEYASRFDVRGIPTMILFKNGKDVEQIVGNAAKDSILATLQKHI